MSRHTSRVSIAFGFPSRTVLTPIARMQKNRAFGFVKPVKVLRQFNNKDKILELLNASTPQLIAKLEKELAACVGVSVNDLHPSDVAHAKADALHNGLVQLINARNFSLPNLVQKWTDVVEPEDALMSFTRVFMAMDVRMEDDFAYFFTSAPTVQNIFNEKLTKVGPGIALALRCVASASRCGTSPCNMHGNTCAWHGRAPTCGMHPCFCISPAAGQAQDWQPEAEVPVQCLSAGGVSRSYLRPRLWHHEVQQPHGMGAHGCGGQDVWGVGTPHR